MLSRQKAGRASVKSSLVGNIEMATTALTAPTATRQLLSRAAWRWISWGRCSASEAAFCSRAAINAMGYGGHIINISSESKEDYYPHHTVYQSTKGGIETLSKHLAIELRPKGIRVTVARAGPMYDENQKMQAAPDVAAAFYQACVECGIDLSQRPVSHFQSIMWVFRSLVDMPADMHVDMVNMMARHPSEEAFKRY